MDWEKMDRRRFTRIEYPCLVTIRKNAPPKLTILTHTENISVGGVCIVIWERIELMAKVDLEIDLKDTSPPIISKGVVKWTKKSSADRAEEYSYNTGIQFTDLKDEYKRRIGNVIDKHLNKSS